MARAWKVALTLCLAVGLTSTALGQGQIPQQPGLHPFSNPDLQKELRLSEEQLSKLQDAFGKVMEKYKDDFLKFSQMPLEQQQQTAPKLMKAIGEDYDKATSGILDAKQWKRYKQIQWQSFGVMALQDPELQKGLKLNDEQKKKLESAFNDFTKKMQELAKFGTAPEKYQAVVQDLEKKTNDVLTQEQQKNLKELKGPPFKLTTLPSPPRPPSAK